MYCELKMIPCTILFLLLQGLDAVIVSLNETEYSRMPPVFKMDAYESCIHQPNGLYCDIELTLVSDTPSQLLTMIHEYSAHTITHYNHTKMHYSVCVTKTCSEFYTNTTMDLKSTLEACLNDSLWQTYQLKARVSDGYSCNVHKDNLMIGVGDFIVAGICLTILVANFIGTSWDFFYTNKVESKGIQLLLCFSISRNWKKLTAPGGSDPRLRPMQGIHGLRVILMCAVIGCHSLWPIVSFCENTQFIEELYQTPVANTIANGTLVMQTFLLISGTLLVYNLQRHAETHNVSWAKIPKLMLLRWWRLTPAYGIVLGLTATWLRYVSSGPRWQYIVGDEAQDCRQYWWLHLLYLNNYFDHSKCMTQTWYLATDTQLYIIGLLVCVLCRSTTARKVVLSLLLVGGTMTPALHTYYQDLDPVLINRPETALKLFTGDRTFDNVYKRGHTNLAGYVIGLSIGYLVYHWQTSGFNVKKFKSFRILCWAALPLSVCVIFTGSVFYGDRPRDHALLRALYAGVAKPVFAVLIGAIMVGIIMKIEGVYRGVLEWRGWVQPSRLTYSAYLCHMAYVRSSPALRTTTIHVTILRMVENDLMSIAVAFAAALVLWLLVEAPLSKFMKLLTKDTPNPLKTDHELGKVNLAMMPPSYDSRSQPLV